MKSLGSGRRRTSRDVSKSGNTSYLTWIGLDISLATFGIVSHFVPDTLHCVKTAPVPHAGCEAGIPWHQMLRSSRVAGSRTLHLDTVDLSTGRKGPGMPSTAATTRHFANSASLPLADGGERRFAQKSIFKLVIHDRSSHSRVEASGVGNAAFVKGRYATHCKPSASVLTLGLKVPRRQALGAANCGPFFHSYAFGLRSPTPLIWVRRPQPTWLGQAVHDDQVARIAFSPPHCACESNFSF